MAYNYEYPYTDPTRSNADWIINRIKELTADFKNFIINNEIKYADPIEWNISTQYTGNTIVINDNVAYISKKEVPNGIDITNTEYWLKILDFGLFYETIKQSIALSDDHASTTTTEDRTTNSLVWLNDKLYIVLRDMNIGDAYILGGANPNIKAITIEEIIRPTSEKIEELENEIISFEHEITEKVSKVGNCEFTSSMAFRILSKTIDPDNPTSEAVYGTTQGSCVVDDNHIVMCFIDNNTNTRKVNDCLFKVFDKNGNLIREKVVEGVLHCNDIEYSNGKLYVANNEMWIGGQYSSSTKLHVIDYETLTYERGIETYNYLYGVCSDSDGNIYVGRYNANTITIGKIDLSTGVIDDICVVSTPLFPPTYQTLTFDGDYFYIGNAYRSSIYKINLSGIIVDTYAFDMIDNQYIIDEIEAVKYNPYTKNFLVTFVNKFGVCETYNGVAWWGRNVTHSNRLVGYNISYSNKDTLPDGSSNKPFNSLNECLYVLKGTLLTKDTIYITLQATSEEIDVADIIDHKSGISLNLGGNTIRGLHICNSNVRCYNGTINGKCGSLSGSVVSWNSILSLYNLTLNVLNNDKRAIDCNNCVTRLEQITYTNAHTSCITANECEIFVDLLNSTGMVQNMCQGSYTTLTTNLNKPTNLDKTKVAYPTNLFNVKSKITPFTWAGGNLTENVAYIKQYVLATREYICLIASAGQSPRQKVVLTREDGSNRYIGEWIAYDNTNKGIIVDFTVDLDAMTYTWNTYKLADKSVVNVNKNFYALYIE